MTSVHPELTEADALVAAIKLADSPGRSLLGVTGPPGAGKSTYAEQLVDAVNHAGRSAVLVPMDGFHLAHSALVSLGLADIKGAPETFDAAGYLDLLRRIREPGEETVWAPRFDRSIEDAIAASIPIQPTVDLVVTEGNYLLLPQGQWWLVRLQLDECWFIDARRRGAPPPAPVPPRAVRSHQRRGRRAGVGQRRGQRRPGQPHPRSGGRGHPAGCASPLSAATANRPSDSRS